MADPTRPLLARILADLGLDPASAASVREPHMRLPLTSALDVGTLLQDSVDAAGLLASRSAPSLTGMSGADPERIVMAVTSERQLLIDNAAPSVWAPLSDFWPAADGWVRTHGNYPHHAARLRAALGLASDAGSAEVRAAIASERSETIEHAVAVAGGIAVAVRRQLPDAEAERAATPLVATTAIASAPARTRIAGPLALHGVRVLDLTRVIAGPVASRSLALFGADVLRIDSPRLPEIEWQHLDGGSGKRTALLDLTAPDDRRIFNGLLSSADVIILGYRPSSLETLGLSPRALAERAPGIVIARLSAWGFAPGEAERRGFDSIVQAASGISWEESADGATPGALPAQALDHSAGYLLAAGVIAALEAQRAEGGTRLVSTSLRRIAAELLTLPRQPRSLPVARSIDAADHTIEYPVDGRRVRVVRPAPLYDAGPIDFAHGPHRWGSDAAEWLPR